MDSEFNQVCNKLISEDTTTLVVAVSGGVDSIVLLDLTLNYAKQAGKNVVVAHFNHKLRAESDEECKWLDNYCQKNGLVFRSEVWSEASVKSNIEALARKARYTFLKELYEEFSSAVILTGHHKNDLAETILMKMTTGSRLRNLVGIRQKREMNGMTVIRPLLSFTKERLYSYASDNGLCYFEDESNSDMRYKRNRIRHKVVPLFLEENPRFLDRMEKLSQDVSFASDIITKHIERIWMDVVSENEVGYIINLDKFLNLAESEQHFVLEELFQRSLITAGDRITDKQVLAVKKLVSNNKPNGRVDLENSWQIVKQYNTAVLSNGIAPMSGKFRVQIESVDSVVPLSKGFFKLSKSDIATGDSVSTDRFTLELNESQFPLTVRNWEPGDRLKYNKSGQHKKINRLLIEKKVPREKRADFLVVLDNQNEILSLFLGEESYLSISPETDKIHYRLTYSLEG